MSIPSSSYWQAWVLLLYLEWPRLHLDRDLIFYPLLYEAAWYTSWNNFWKWKRAIALFAFGLVFFNSTVIPQDETREAALHQEIVYHHFAWLTALRFQLREVKTGKI